MDFRIGQLVVEIVRHDEIVNAPSSVFLSRLETVGPPRVDARFVGVEEAESVGEARIEEMGELLALLVGEAGIAAVGLRIFQVDFLVCYVEVAAGNDGFLLPELREVVAEVLVPFHAVVQAAQAILRIGNIGRNHKIFRHLQRDDASFVVVFVDAEAVADGQGFMARIDGSSRIALLVGIRPIALIAFKLKVELSGLHLRFLQAEEIGIKGLEGFAKTFAVTGSQPVDIPRYEFCHCDVFS